MYPVLFKIGAVSVYSWGAMVALAFVAGIWLGVARAKKEGIPADIALDTCFYVMISSVIGARVFYVIGFPGEFLASPLKALAFWEGGMVFYGGLVFAILTMAWYLSRKKIPVLKAMDIAAPSVAIGYAIGRIGCFLRGCCYGKECGLPWAMNFPDAAGLVHPTQLYSALAGLVMFILLVGFRDKKRYDGQVVLWGITLYAGYRFFIEFFRYSSLYWLWFTPSQWISILGLGVGVWGLAYFKRKKTSL